MPIPDSIAFAGGQILTAAQCNTGWSALLNHLAGRDGVVEYEGSILVLDGSAGDHYVDVPTGTTAQRPSSPKAGEIRFNTTTNREEWWTGSEWASVDLSDAVVTYENLNANGDVGIGSNQAAQGNHDH